MTSQERAADKGGCDHVGGPELIEMSEAWLREHSISEEGWNGSRFAWGEVVDSPYWKSVYIEIERREKLWVVTRIDRLNETLDESRTGFQVIERSWKESS